MSLPEYIFLLYDDGKYHDCLAGVEKYLQANPTAVKALLLKAKCQLELLNQDETETQLLSWQMVYQSFLAVLAQQPTHETALYFAANISIYTLHYNLTQAVRHCTQLLQSTNPDMRWAALKFRSQAFRQLNQADPALADLEQLIHDLLPEYRKSPKDFNHRLNSAHLDRGDIYLHLKKDPHQALRAYQDSLAYPHANSSIYTFIANLAFDHQHWELGSNAAVYAIFYNAHIEEEHLVALYHRLENLRKKGIENYALIRAIFISLLKLGNVITGKDSAAAEILALAEHYIHSHPDWPGPYRCAGAVYYFEKNYSAALPYLKAALARGAGALVLQRYIECTYRVTQQLPTEIVWPDDLPTDYFNAGVMFHNHFEQSEATPETYRSFLELRCKFYEHSYRAFYAYFYQGDTSKRISPDDYHTFAMCCNNYGISLNELGESARAVEIHQQGYDISPFWEQAASRCMALNQLQRYEESIAVANEALLSNRGYLSFAGYIRLKGLALEAHMALGHTATAKQQLQGIDREYQDFLKKHKHELSAEELFDLSQKYIEIQNARFELLSASSKDNPEETNRAWLEQLMINPDDNSAYYMLMQNYYQQKNYPQCIACADNYEQVKGKAIDMKDKAKVYFLRGTAHLRLGQYQKAIHNLNVVQQLNDKGLYRLDATGQADMYIRLTLAYHGLQHWQECNRCSRQVVDLFNANGWGWDNDLLQIMLCQADSWHALGHNKNALSNLDTILASDPDNQEARKRKESWRTRGLFSFLKKSPRT